MTWPSHNLFF